MQKVIFSIFECRNFLLKAMFCADLRREIVFMLKDNIQLVRLLFA